MVRDTVKSSSERPDPFPQRLVDPLALTPISQLVHHQRGLRPRGRHISQPRPQIRATILVDRNVRDVAQRNARPLQAECN
jgi:hypothetical protein